MAVWTNVSGSITFQKDYFDAYNIEFALQDNFIKNSPQGSEGGLYFTFLKCGEYAIDVKFSGALRDYNNQDEIIAWFNTGLVLKPWNHFLKSDVVDRGVILDRKILVNEY